MIDDVRRISAFAKNGLGGNPAGVAILDQPLDEATMRATAAEVGYSETAFAYRADDGWRVRYFSPEQEVPFCGHATIALGAVLGSVDGEGIYKLYLNEAQITVEASKEQAKEGDGTWAAALQSPATRSAPMPDDIRKVLLTAFGLSEDDLDPRIPPSIAEGGARHVVLALRDRGMLRDMTYEFEPMRRFMVERGLVTIDLVWAESETRFHARNAFAFGGVYEDPATGAAAAAFAGLLRDIGWPGIARTGADQAATRLEIIQGEDMNVPSRLLVDVPPTKGESIRVSGATRSLV